MEYSHCTHMLLGGSSYIYDTIITLQGVHTIAEAAFCDIDRGLK